MSLAAWRQFNFFDLTPIKDPSSPDEGLLYSDLRITTMSAGGESVFMGSSSGIIKEMDSNMRLVREFLAYDPDWTITHVHYLSGTSLLMTVGTKLGEPAKILLWDLEKADKVTGRPHLHSTVTVMNGPNTYPLSAFCVTSEHDMLGCGFADGTVVLVRGDIVRDRGYRQRVVFRSSSPVTGLGFYEDGSSGVITLFVATVSQILTVPTTGRNSGKPETILDKSKGAALGCVVQESNDKRQGRLVVARDNEVIYFTTSMRGPSFAFPMEKRSIFSFKEYLVITTTGNVTSSSSPSQSGAGAPSPISALIGSEAVRILIIDTTNKFVAFSGQIAVGIKHMFVQWGTFYVVGSDGILYAFTEKSVDSRLDILKQRQLYDVAIQLATNLRVPTPRVMQIEREFADHLYRQDELEEAVGHYISAIDLGDTSQVILKYRDSQNTGSLTRYLEALHFKGVATKEHTTLLLNSYAKLKDASKLVDFVQAANDGLNGIDYEMAIDICRQAGYYSLAVFLAQRAGDADLAVYTKLHDLNDFRGCLDYIKSLEVADALRILIQHSRILLDRYPMETTALLISLFTGKFSPVPLDIRIDSVAVGDSSGVAQHEGFVAGVETSSSRAQSDVNQFTAPVIQSYHAFVSYMSNLPSLPTSNGHSASFSLNDSGPSVANGGGPLSPSTQMTSDIPTYQPPRPRLIFSSFIDHPNEFVIFLEACLECHDEFEANEKDRGDLLSTLLEMYLSLAERASRSEERTEWQTKARELADKHKNRVDRNTVLLLSHLFSFPDGTIVARSGDPGFRVDMFRACAAASDVSGAISVLREYGNEERELFPLALSFFVSSTSILEQAGMDEFVYVLDTINQYRLMTPLQVIQSLSVNSVATVGHVRQYLIDAINHEKSEIEKNRTLADSYRAEASSKKSEINRLLNDPIVVQYTTCSSCGTALDLPAVHFACKHSFHQRCLTSTVGEDHQSGDEVQCPSCQPELEEVRALRRAQDDTTERADLFDTALEDSDNKYKVVTDFVGRGALTISV